MSRLITFGLPALLLCGAVSAAGTTTLYKWTDAQGVVHYSDSPQPGAQKIEVQAAQTYKAPAPPANAAYGPGSAAASRTAGQPGGYTCSIASPQPDQSFFSPDSIAVSVSVSPAMQDGDQLQVTVDGAAVPPTIDQVIIQQPARGAHTVSATVRGADG